MNLAELQADVYSLTNRPDLVGDTLVAIRAAVLKMHHSDFYYKDIEQATIALSVGDYANTFEATLLQRYRAMSFIRKWYPTGVNARTLLPQGRAGKKLDSVDTNNIFDNFGRERKDVYYVAGNQVSLLLSDTCQNFLIGWYKHPPITATEIVSWIANEHPYAIIYDAAATVFKGIGYDEQSSRFGNLVTEQITMLKMSNIEQEAR